MRSFVGWLLAAVVLSGTTGCQCNVFYEPYSDVMDDVSESWGHFDWLYTPCLDLTRIGKSDWCECWKAPFSCRQDCRQCRPNGSSCYQEGLEIDTTPDYPR